jgi:hypothetical protein
MYRCAILDAVTVTATTAHLGDPFPGFMAEPGRCWRVVYDHNLQATTVRRCRAGGALVQSAGRPLVAVWACPEHLEG